MEEPPRALPGVRAECGEGVRSTREVAGPPEAPGQWRSGEVAHGRGRRPFATSLLCHQGNFATVAKKRGKVALVAFVRQSRRGDQGLNTLTADFGDLPCQGRPQGKCSRDEKQAGECSGENPDCQRPANPFSPSSVTSHTPSARDWSPRAGWRP